MDRFSKVAFSITGICGAVFAVANWDWLVVEAQSAFHQASVASEASGSRGVVWTESQSVDEMTDNVRTKATTTLPWAGGDMVVDIECVAPNKLSYSFVAYDANGDGVPFKYELGEDASGAARQFATVKVRMDEQKAASSTLPIKNYTNEIYMEGNEAKWMKELWAVYGYRPSVGVNDMASARLLRIFFKAKDREGVLRIEQDDPIVRRVFANCSVGQQIQSSVSDPVSPNHRTQQPSGEIAAAPPSDPAPIQEENWSQVELAAIKVYEDLNDTCRGSSGAISDAACEERDNGPAWRRLRELNICFGLISDEVYQMRMHRCRPDSIQ